MRGHSNVQGHPLHVVHVISEESIEDQAVRNGFIDASVIREEVADWRNSHYFIVGPTAMVTAMQDCLDDCGVPPEQVTIDSFAGY